MESETPSEMDLQLWNAVETHPPGTFRLYRGDGVGTEDKIHQHLANGREIAARIRKAQQAGCAIEVISLRLQVIDFWLRVFFVNKAPVGATRGREFGKLLKQCFQLGFSKHLYDSVLAFNKLRIDAIHGFVVGSTSYESINAIGPASEQLLKDSVMFVARNCGTIVSNREELRANVGSMTIKVEDFCAEIQAGKHY